MDQGVGDNEGLSLSDMRYTLGAVKTPQGHSELMGNDTHEYKELKSCA